MKTINKNIKTLVFDDGFCIDIIPTDNGYEAWIYRADIGVKTLTFGVADMSESDFMEIVLNGIDKQKEYYDEKYGE